MSGVLLSLEHDDQGLVLLLPDDVKFLVVPRPVSLPPPTSAEVGSETVKVVTDHDVASLDF